MQKSMQKDNRKTNQGTHENTITIIMYTLIVITIATMCFLIYNLAQTLTTLKSYT